MTGVVYFVGGGPGDPELLTLKAKRVIDSADVIIFTGSLLRESLFRDTKPGVAIHDSAGLHLEEIIALMVSAARDGRVVARVHSGDPTIFGAIHEQMVALEREGVRYEIIPGVSSVFAAAAALRTELTVPEVAQTVILTRTAGRTPMPNGEQLHDLARHGATIALYLSAQLIAQAARELRVGYPADTPVAVVANASLPDQQIVRGTLDDIAALVKAAGIRAQAIILVGPALDPAIKRTAAARKSRLYDRTFTHSFRQGVRDAE
ncbi:MAG: precorrin-4 C(11)-methyltransferase [Candidatus Binatia bacterium]|nr:precorrin-4 C(11)-methyltransferase [Candidatus Binatia bacterium]